MVMDTSHVAAEVHVAAGVHVAAVAHVAAVSPPPGCRHAPSLCPTPRPRPQKFYFLSEYSSSRVTAPPAASPAFVPADVVSTLN